MSLPTLQIFDTMSGAKRPLQPLKPGHVGIYVCGVTVYDLTHIGHARVFVSFDVITRYLRHRGYDVTYVRNHTDVDDKIIQRAAERGEDPTALAARFIDELHRDFDALGVARPDVAPKVTEHIPQIIAMVERLVETGHAYVVDGDVYYAVDSFPTYGKLSGMKLDEMRAGERVDVDTRKKNPADFALWKSRKEGEPAWPSPWGEGRPGWHIECSAMSTEYLGPHFDIHGGGKDLVFPHHENEIAQSEGACGETFADTWMHVGLVNVDGEKMSKSLGNFWTVRDVLDKYHPEAVRAFFLAAHYRKPVSYSAANLDQARARLQYLYTTRQALASLWERVERPAADAATRDELFGRMYGGMDDDFNTPVAVAVAGEAARVANELLGTKKLAKRADVLAKLAAIDAFFDAFAEIFGVLGGDPAEVLLAIRAKLAEQLGIDPSEVLEQIAARNQARADKDWAAADAVRDALTARHVELMDGPDGTDWRIVPPDNDAADSPDPS
jgi:cysteinyl-tRNA synthetase